MKKASEVQFGYGCGLLAASLVAWFKPHFWWIGALFGVYFVAINLWRGRKNA